MKSPLSSLILVLMAFLLGTLPALAAEGPALESFGRLAEVVGFPDNSDDAAPLFLAMAEAEKNGVFTQEDLQKGRITPEQVAVIVRSGAFEAHDQPVIRIVDGKLATNLEFDLPGSGLLTSIRWTRGLPDRIQLRLDGGDPEAAWREIRESAIVALHLYGYRGELIYRLLGVAMLRLTATYALRFDFPQIVEHRQLLEETAETCKHERIAGDQVLRFMIGPKLYLRFSDRDEDKVIFDLVGLLKRAEARKHHPFGAELFVAAIYHTAAADDERAWNLLFGSVDRFRDSENRAVQTLIAELFDHHERSEIEAALRSGSLGG